MLKGTEAAAALHSHLTLFMCWPEAEFASRALALYKGSRLIFVGEKNHCNLCGGYRKLFAQLRKGWRLVAEAPLPNWPGCHDKLYVYERC